MRRTAAVVAAAPRLLLVVSASLVLSIAVLLAPSAPAATGVPSPESVLGFVPGEDRKLADWSQVLAYLKALDEASDRVSVEEVGKTTQGRPFVIVTVTSAANHARLEEIRQRQRAPRRPPGARRGRRRSGSSGTARPSWPWRSRSTRPRWAARSPRCASCTTSPRATTSAVRAMLDATVLLVLPSHNPDGTDLVAEWYRRQLGTPFEGTSPPVLYHPYAGHDNNRDWYMFTQPETRLTRPAPLPPVAPADRARRAPDGPAGGAPLRAALRRPVGAERGRRARRRRGRARVARGLAPHHRGPRGRRHRRALRRVDAGPRVSPHARRGAPPLRDGLRAPRDAGRGEAGGAGAARLRLRPARRLRQLPGALAGRNVAARRRRRDAAPGLARHPRARRGAPGALAADGARGEPPGLRPARSVRVRRALRAARPLGGRPARRGAPPGRGGGAAGPGALRGGGAARTRRGLSSSGCSSRRAASRRRSSSGSATRTCASTRAAPRGGRTTSRRTRCRCSSAWRWRRWPRPSWPTSSRSRPRASLPGASRATLPASPSATRAASSWPSAACSSRA